MITRFLKTNHGATAIEYALLVACIALAIVAILPLIGVDVYNRFIAVYNSFP